MRKFVRKRAYLTILDKHPSAMFGPFSLGSFYLEIGWSVDMMITFLFGIFSLLSK